MIDIKSLTYNELVKEVERIGEKACREKQIYKWVHVKQARSFAAIGNLSQGLRDRLSSNYTLTVLEENCVQESKIDGTKKFLFALEDGNVVESVWMRYKHGNSVCISSQVGCRMGCRLCASTLGGLAR